jgi:hypothetical protein
VISTSTRWSRNSTTTNERSPAGADTMAATDFAAVWATVVDPDGYPVLRALDRAAQLEGRS